MIQLELISAIFAIILKFLLSCLGLDYQLSLALNLG